MAKTPEISLIMSVYNGEDYLAEAIESVLSQTFEDFELIIINDCSTDKTGEILAEFEKADDRVKVHTNEVNLRLPSSLNKAMALAQGKYIARMDADDICLPERLERQYKFMEENPDVALSSCRFMTIKNGVIASGGGGGRFDSQSIKALLLVTNPILHPGIIAKAEVIKSLGYDKEFTCTEDMELWTRFVLAGQRVEILPEYLMIYRLHDKQITGTTLEKQHREIKMVQSKYLAELFEPMDEETAEFYINGIYFRDKMDIDKFCRFYKWLKTVNKRKKAMDTDSISYAMFEILAEYKRNGITKSQLIKGMLAFGVPYLLKEIPDRKKRAQNDGRNCIKSAEAIGLYHSDGKLEFPTFSRK